MRSHFNRIALLASCAMMVGGAAFSQTVQVFDEVPSIEQLRSIMVPESRAGASRSIVIQHPDLGTPTTVQRASTQVLPAPRPPVAKPAAFKTSAIVRSPRFSRSPPVEVLLTPPRGWYRPVSHSARVGEQTGQTKNRSNKAPSRASESMFGVLRFVLPWTLRSPQP